MQNFNSVDEKLIGPVVVKAINNPVASSSTSSTVSTLTLPLNQPTRTPIDQSETQADVNSMSEEENNSNQDNPEMANNITNIDYLRLCGDTIPHNFNGDPLQLQSFIAAIDLLNGVAIGATNAAALSPLLASFLKTRLHAKALEHLTNEDTTVANIRARLSGSIKPENEKIIRGKMAALRADRNTLADFAKQADTLADCLKRALVLDGIPPAKATSMVIDETISMCKSSARSDYVRSVLASTSYTTPKEVVAKFVIEVGNDKDTKQVLAFNAMKQQQGQQNKYRGQRNNFNQNWSRKPRNRQFRYPNSYGNNNNRQNDNHRNGNNFNRQFQNRNYQQNSQNRRQGYNNTNNNRNVRYIEASENSGAPQRALGANASSTQN